MSREPCSWNPVQLAMDNVHGVAAASAVPCSLPHVFAGSRFLKENNRTDRGDCRKTGRFDSSYVTSREYFPTSGMLDSRSPYNTCIQHLRLEYHITTSRYMYTSHNLNPLPNIMLPGHRNAWHDLALHRFKAPPPVIFPLCPSSLSTAPWGSMAMQ